MSVEVVCVCVCERIARVLWSLWRIYSGFIFAQQQYYTQTKAEKIWIEKKNQQKTETKAQQQQHHEAAKSKNNIYSEFSAYLE